MATRTTTKQHIPDFASVEEEAAFWDTHSPLDYPREWREVPRAEGHKPLGHILGVRLDAATLDKLATIARKKGVGPSTLARMWLLERLDETEHEPAHAQTR